MLIFLLSACAPEPVLIGPAERPTQVISPSDWDGQQALPTVFLLHGLGAHAERQDWYMGFSEQVDALRFHLVLPEGLERPQDGRQSWDATEFCCNTEAEVDDVGFLLGLQDELEQELGAQAGARFFGHSNGHFMSYRMACEAPDRIHAIGGLAGAVSWDEADCAVGEPVDVLHLHGQDDATILYEGSEGEYPGAQTSVARWSERAGCTGSEAGARLDLTRTNQDETAVERHTGCSHRVELWTLEDSGHSPWLNGPRFSAAVLEWLLEAE